MVQDILDELNGNMENGLAAMKRSMQKVRTGRASIGILDGVMVGYYVRVPWSVLKRRS